MNPDSLKSKIKLISENLKELKNIFPATFTEFQNKKTELAAIERYFQIIVDSVIDCNQLIIEENQLNKSDTYFKTFENLKGKSIFPDDLLENLSYSVGTRNALVHRYENIQLRREFEDIKKYIPLFKNYLKIISEKFL